MLAQKHTDRLEDIKQKVTDSYQYFNENAKRFDEFMRFVYKTSLTNEDITKLQTLNKPTLEFNIIEATISRLRGEFARQEPSITVRASDGIRIEDFTEDYLKLLSFLESYLREMLLASHTDDLQDKIFRDQLGGGYSVVEIYTDYINEVSFDQNIHVRRVFDPTLTGFDPLARESHKGDGSYCFQLFPRTKDEFIAEFGEKAADNMKFSRVDQFSWSYKNQNQEIVLICDFYEKKRKKVKIVKLSTGHVVVKAHYEELLEQWKKQDFIEQAPIVIEERMSEIETIERYQICETAVLSHDKTNYKFLPLVFIDGNSVEIKDSDSNYAAQMTRPYAYQAQGIQKLKNFAGQTVAAEIENMVQHKFIVSIESVPEDYQEAYRNVQLMDVLMYNAFYDKNPDVRLDPPREVQRTPTPPLVQDIFLGSDRITQAILGSYDSTLATNEQNVSGVAIANGAIQTSAASTPYLIGYINGLNRIAQVVIDLIPKYIVTPRTLPVRDSTGKRSYRIVNNPNHPENIDITYKSNDLQVNVEAGVNSAIQKQVALDQIIKMMQASELFSQFINTMGLETILGNMDIRGIEELKVMAMKFMEMQQQKMEEQANKVDPQIEVEQGLVQVEAAKVEQRHEEAEGRLAIDAAKVAIEKQKVDAQVMSILNDIESKNAKLALEQEKVDSENARTAVETAIDISKMASERREETHE